MLLFFVFFCYWLYVLVLIRTHKEMDNFTIGKIPLQLSLDQGGVGGYDCSHTPKIQIWQWKNKKEMMPGSFICLVWFFVQRERERDHLLQQLDWKTKNKSIFFIFQHTLIITIFFWTVLFEGLISLLWSVFFENSKQWSFILYKDWEREREQWI